MLEKNKKRIDNIVNRNQKNTIDYRFEMPGADIRMSHFVHVNLFALKMNGKTSLVNPKRGYHIIKKWKDPDYLNKLSVTGDILDIEIDNIFACGGKILR